MADGNSVGIAVSTPSRQRSTGAGAVDVALELDGAQPRCPLPDGRLGPAEPLGQVAAAMLPVELRGQANGRILGFRPTATHRNNIPE